MTDITIPPAALEAGARAIRTFYSDEPVAVCDGVAYKAARATCLAMLKAWPGMIHGKYFAEPSIILPLPQENSDE